MRGWNWEMQSRASVALWGFFSEWFLQKCCRLQRPLIEKNTTLKKTKKTQTTWRFSETGCDWLDPTLKHNVVPVFSSQRLSYCWSGQNIKHINLIREANIDEGRSNKNDQWSFPFSFRLPRKQSFSSNNLSPPVSVSYESGKGGLSFSSDKSSCL